MPQTSREIMTRCLKFEHPERMPRDLWALPWADWTFPETMARLRGRFPSDIGGPAYVYQPSPRVQGDPYRIGTYVDEWGAIFTNIQAGMIGEVRTPALAHVEHDEEVFGDAACVFGLPEEWLPAGGDAAAATE